MVLEVQGTSLYIKEAGPDALTMDVAQSTEQGADKRAGQDATGVLSSDGTELVLSSANFNDLLDFLHKRVASRQLEQYNFS